MVRLDIKSDETLKKLAKETESAPKDLHTDGQDLAMTLLKVAGLKTYRQNWENGVESLREAINGNKELTPEQLKYVIKQMGICGQAEGGTYSDSFVVEFYEKIQNKINKRSEDHQENSSDKTEVDTASDADGEDAADSIINTIVSRDAQKKWEEGRVLLGSILNGETRASSDYVLTALSKMGISSFSSGGVFADGFVQSMKDEIVRIATACTNARTKHVNDGLEEVNEELVINEVLGQKSNEEKGEV